MRLLLSLSLLALLGQQVSAQSPPSATPQKDHKTVNVRVNHLLDLDYMIRKHAGSDSKLPNPPPGFDELVSIAREVSSEFGGAIGPGWAAVDAALLRCENGKAFVEAAARLPESTTSRSGKQIKVREAAVRYAAAFSAFEPTFLSSIWPQHNKVIEDTLATITRTLIPRERECFAYLTRHLGMDGAALTQVPVYLVAESPWPGGFTFWDRDKRGTCVVSIEANQGTGLFEAILHEAIHALALETEQKGNVLMEISNRLVKAGVTENDLALRHGPHLLVFIQSAETVRRLLDPSHQPYGNREGVYARLGKLSSVEIPIWTSYLDGKISRDKAIERIVEGLIETTKREPRQARESVEAPGETERDSGATAPRRERASRSRNCSGCDSLFASIPHAKMRAH